jgi:hypothetical protein
MFTIKRGLRPAPLQPRLWLARRKSIGPKPGFEVIVPGRQDALMATSRLAGAPTSLCLRRAFFFSTSQ